MVVSIKASYTIKPSEATWEGVLHLAEWDQTGVITHVPTITFYKKPSSEEWAANSDSIVATLKGSLSRALVHFYPLAGRVRWVGQGRLELVCNAKGAQLFEAESSTQLSDFDDFGSHINEFRDLVPLVDYEKPIYELPLMLAQLTVFRCGGISLGITMSHAVADGQSAFHFMNEWARLARGEPIQAAPYIDYSLLAAGQSHKFKTTPCDQHAELVQPPLLIGEQSSLKERKKPTTISILSLTKEQVESLKMVADAGGDHAYEKRRPYSRYEVVTAHMWRTACKARKHLPEQPTGLGFSVDVRNRLNPPLPPNYFGNAILDMVAYATAGEVMTKPLSHTCGKIRETIERVNDEYVWANIECLKNLPNLTPLQDLHSRKGDDSPFHGNPNLGVISWLNLPIYGLDFGWGKEVYMGPGIHNSDGDCLMLPGPVNDGSVKIALCLQVAHADDFKKYFYEDIQI